MFSVLIIDDEPMIRNAGLGVAMGNASPYIKSIAKKVVADNNSSGVAEAIKAILNWQNITVILQKYYF